MTEEQRAEKSREYRQRPAVLAADRARKATPDYKARQAEYRRMQRARDTDRPRSDGMGLLIA